MGCITHSISCKQQKILFAQMSLHPVLCLTRTFTMSNVLHVACHPLDPLELAAYTSSLPSHRHLVPNIGDKQGAVVIMRDAMPFTASCTPANHEAQ